MSIIPWRRADVKYVQNEIYFDIVEEVDMIIERCGAAVGGCGSVTAARPPLLPRSNGNAVSSDVRGTITCNCRLSGTPDLTLLFNTPAVIEDASFHPCVRLTRWEREQVRAHAGSGEEGGQGLAHASSLPPAPQVVSFVPPDGPFTLMTYRTNDRSPPLPLYVRPSVIWRDGQGKVGSGRGGRGARHGNCWLCSYRHWQGRGP